MNLVSSPQWPSPWCLSTPARPVAGRGCLWPVRADLTEAIWNLGMTAPDLAMGRRSPQAAIVNRVIDASYTLKFAFDDSSHRRASSLG